MSQIQTKPKNKQSQKSVIVLKFGSSVMKTEDDLKTIVHEIYGYLRKGKKVIAVVSAIGNDTDHLLRQANYIYDQQNPLIPMLVRLGEFRSAALLSMALLKIGIKAVTIDPVNIDLIATGKNMNAKLSSVNQKTLDHLLEHNDSVIIPGYVAVNKQGEYVTLGRGGTDLTAIFLGIKLQAEKVRLIKDVDGIYIKDPNKSSEIKKNTLPLKELDFHHALKVNKGVIQKKALKEASIYNYPVSVGGLIRNYETMIGAKNLDINFKSKYDKFKNLNHQKFKIALLGCGVVGHGVYEHCLRHSKFFKLNHILVKNPDKHKNLPDSILTDQANEIDFDHIDVLIEVMGGIDPAYQLIKAALKKGVPVITANKQLIAHYFNELKQLAYQNNVPILYSAAVGGGMPILESIDLCVKKQQKIISIESVVNGTTNFVLDQIFKGISYEQAVKRAQQAGFAEADPSMDLDGCDAAAKLSIMIQHAFQYELPVDQIKQQALSEITQFDIKQLKKQKQTIRHIAKCQIEKDIIRAEIALNILDHKHFLAGAFNEENRAIIHFENETLAYLSGKGAGCSPTSEAVMADLFDCLRLKEHKNSS